MGQTGFCKNLRFAAVFCENLRFPAKICAPEMLSFPGKAKISKNLQKSAKNCEFQSFVPFSLSLLIPSDKSLGSEGGGGHLCVLPVPARTPSFASPNVWILERPCRGNGTFYAAPIGAFFCPEIRAFTGFWGEISSTVSKVLSGHEVLFKHKNGAVNSR